MKKILRKIFKLSGYAVIRSKDEALPGSISRPVGNMIYLLEDLKFRGLGCRSVFDIGANKGDWSRIAVNIFPDATFTLIEPQIEMKSALEAFCTQYKNAHFYLYGAGPANTKMTLTIWNDLLGSSFIPKTKPELLAQGKQREVDIITIDSLIKEKNIPMPDLIKLDIQGFELEALKGAESTFGEAEVYILEVSFFPFDDISSAPVFADIIKFMSDRNYALYDFGGFMRRPYDGALGQCDCCFVKKDGFLRSSNSWN